MYTLALKYWIGELFNRQNTLNQRLIRFFIREKYFKKLILYFMGFKTNNTKSINYISFQKKGFLRLKPISQKKIQQIYKDLKNLTFISGGEFPSKISGDNLLKAVNEERNNFEISSQIYRNTDVIDHSSVIKEIAYSKTILDLVHEYLGSKEILVDGQVWFTYGGENLKYKSAKHNFGWHYDIDDLHWVKVFIYLNDVNKNSGPHEFIEGSHSLSSLKKILFRRVETEKEFKSFNFNPSKIIQFTGSAGTAFIEDTFGYHRGLDPEKDRIILQFTYRVGVV